MLGLLMVEARNDLSIIKYMERYSILSLFFLSQFPSKIIQVITQKLVIFSYIAAFGS